MPLRTPAVFLISCGELALEGRQLGDHLRLGGHVLLDLRLARLGVGQLVAADDPGAPGETGAPNSPTRRGRRRRTVAKRRLNRRRWGAGPDVELHPGASGAITRSVSWPFT